MDPFDFEWDYIVNCGWDTPTRLVCYISIGLGFRPMCLPAIPHFLDYYNTSCTNGNGYSYKTRLLQNPIIHL